MAKIASWQEAPPEERYLVQTSKEIMNAINEIRDPLNQPIPEHLIREIMVMWYNVIKFYPDIRAPRKTALQALTIYYILELTLVNIA